MEICSAAGKGNGELRTEVSLRSVSVSVSVKTKKAAFRGFFCDSGAIVRFAHELESTTGGFSVRTLRSHRGVIKRQKANFSVCLL